METPPAPLNILEAIDQLPPELKVMIYRYYVALRVREKKTQVYFSLLRIRVMKFYHRCHRRMTGSQFCRRMEVLNRLERGYMKRLVWKQKKHPDLLKIDLKKLALYHKYSVTGMSWARYTRYRRALDRKEKALLQTI